MGLTLRRPASLDLGGAPDLAWRAVSRAGPRATYNASTRSPGHLPAPITQPRLDRAFQETSPRALYLHGVQPFPVAVVKGKENPFPLIVGSAELESQRITIETSLLSIGNATGASTASRCA